MNVTSWPGANTGGSTVNRASGPCWATNRAGAAPPLTTSGRSALPVARCWPALMLSKVTSLTWPVMGRVQERTKALTDEMADDLAQLSKSMTPADKPAQK